MRRSSSPGDFGLPHDLWRRSLCCRFVRLLRIRSELAASLDIFEPRRSSGSFVVRPNHGIGSRPSRSCHRSGRYRNRTNGSRWRRQAADLLPSGAVQRAVAALSLGRLLSGSSAGTIRRSCGMCLLSNSGTGTLARSHTSSGSEEARPRRQLCRRSRRPSGRRSGIRSERELWLPSRRLVDRCVHSS